MVIDSSLTNILLLNGVSHVRYRAYSQSCEHSLFLDFLKCNEGVRSTGLAPQRRRNSTASATENILLKAYWDLIHVNIPCMWRARDESADQDLVTLELWVFWFDDRHTGSIDANDDLCSLEEFTVGSFTWENAYAKSVSPAVVSSVQGSASALVTVSEECKLFIRAVRTLIQASMARRGVFTLGDFFIFSQQRDQHDPSPCTTLLCCAYDVYLSCTDLVFQPCARRMRVRTLETRDRHEKGTRVLLSPSGDSAWISTSRHDISPQVEEHVIRHWSMLFHIPVEQLTAYPQSSRLPAVVAVRTAWSPTILYPTALVFVPTPSRRSPSSIAAMSSVLGANRGLTEDLGEKLSRCIWLGEADKDHHPLDNTNYWAYTNPFSHATSAVLDSIVSNGTVDDQSVLRKVPDALGYCRPMTGVGDQRVSDTQPWSHIGSAGAQRELSLADYAILNFSKVPSSNAPVEFGHGEILPHLSGYSELGMAGFQPTMAPPPFPLQPAPHPMMTSITDNEVTEPTLSPKNPSFSVQQSSMPVWDNNLPMAMHLDTHEDGDTSMYDSLGHWNNGFDRFDNNFDLDVTEEDFNFFESTSSSTSIPSQSTSYPSIGTDNMMLVGQPSVAESVPFPGDMSMMVDLDKLLDTTKEATPDIMVVDTPAPEREKYRLDPGEELVDSKLDNVSESISSQHSEFTPQSESAQATPVADVKAGHCVPPEFAPITLRGVNDAKYSDGGKFTYLPTNTAQAEGKGHIFSIYRPDYAPHLPLKTSNKTLEPWKAHPNHGTDDTITDKMVPDERRDSSSSSSSSGSSSDESSQSGTSHSEFSESETGTGFGDDNHSSVDGWTQSLSRAQQHMAHRMLRGQEAYRQPTPYDVDQLALDYDTPFGTTISSGTRPYKGDVEDAGLLKPLDHLFQQAVMGGYPFSGSLADMSANGGDMTEGESSKVVVSRRRNLVQHLHGSVTHVPCLLDDTTRVLSDFKRTLHALFVPLKSLDSGDLEMERPSLTDIKGPLNLHQYYELSDTNSTHAKYGKYQIKKRRPAEPNLAALSAPDIVVNRQNDSLEGSPNLISFWEKLRLEPYSCKKDVKYIAICPNSPVLEHAMSQFMTSLNTVYDTCLLGKHGPLEVHNFSGGIVPAPLLRKYMRYIDPNPLIRLLARQPGEGWREQQLTSYMAACQNLGSTLGGVSLPDNAHTVVYIVNPIPHLSAYLELCKCFEKLLMAFKAARIGMPTRSSTRLVMQLVPIEHVLRPTAFGGYTKFGLKNVAFSVYSKCHTTIGRSSLKAIRRDSDSHSTSDIYTPPFVLSRSIPETLSYSYKHSLNAAPTLMARGATLHLAYCFSLDRRWMIVVWTDDRGELVDYAALQRPISTTNALLPLFSEAWRRTAAIAQRTGFNWTHTIAKLGLIFEDELKAWLSVLSKKHSKTAIVSVDLESSLHIGTRYADHGNNEETLSSTTDQGPSMYGSSSKGKPPLKALDEVSGTHVLMLNHRVAYTQGRERFQEGVVVTNATVQSDQWMLPLATGYLIHTPQKSASPSLELFDCEPLVIEVHLVLNQTDQSDYSTLRSILHRFFTLSYVNQMPSDSNRIPLHLALVERLCRLLLVADQDDKENSFAERRFQIPR